MGKAPDVVTIDFETHPIGDRPGYPPKPVSVSILYPKKKPDFFAWGHPTGNNCSKRDAQRALKAAWSSPLPKLFFNAKFDVEVATEHMDVKMLPWGQIHDGMFLAFLDDPHSATLELKPLADRLLGEAADEQEALWQWCCENVRKNFPRTKVGEYISQMPGTLVGPYANGDTGRTWRMFKLLYPRIQAMGMMEAYDRERELMPILLENEKVGFRVDLKPLARDIKKYSAARESVDAWLRKRLKAPNMNINSNEEFAEALAKAKLVNDEDWVINKDGTRSVSKTNFTEDMIRDVKVFRAFGYRNRLGTCLNMFMGPWYEQALNNGGRITTNWNQVRQVGGGTRTGRPSTNNHNFLNISKTWDDKEDGYVHPDFIDVPDLPLTRRYVLPDVGDVFGHRDYNQQELRILAHFEDGALMAAYQRDLRMDVHDFVKDLIAQVVGKEWPRRPVKIVNFRTVYGGGKNATAAGVGCSLEEAGELLAAHARALPGVGDLKKQIKALSADNEPIVTWGGRRYFCEPPGYSKKYNREMTYEYKLLNYLVQGSAADATKQAVINYHNHPKRRGRFLVTVYDEINASMPEPKHEMPVLRESMECLEFDVPLLSDGKVGPNWGSLKKWDEPPSKWEK